MPRTINPHYDRMLADIFNACDASINEIQRELDELSREYQRDKARWETRDHDEPINLIDLQDINATARVLVDETANAIRLIKTARHMRTIVVEVEERDLDSAEIIAKEYP